MRRLDAEAIFVMREAVAEFRRLVMLYSIGKDSSVMLHHALKALYPSLPPNVSISALSDEIKNLTGVDQHYEAPEFPEFKLSSAESARPKPPPTRLSLICRRMEC